MHGNGLALNIDPAVLKPLVEQITRQVVAELQEAQAALGDKLAFLEPEAAALLSLSPTQLRDCRLRGEISASRGPGRLAHLYSRQDLLNYLMSRKNGGSND